MVREESLQGCGGRRLSARRAALMLVAAMIGMTPALALAQIPTSTATAVEPSADAARAADEARERGVQFMKEERFADALHAFTQAHKLAPAPRTAAQKGLAEQAMHLWIPAQAHIALALEHGDDPWVKKNRIFLEEAVREIGAHIGSLSLDFARPVADLRLTAAGEWIPWAASGPVRLPEGEIVLEIKADGYAPWRRVVVVRPGAVLHIPVELAASTPPLSSPLPPAPTLSAPAFHSTTAPTWLVVTTAVIGLAAVSYGGYLLAADGDPACGGATPCARIQHTRLPGMLLVGAGAALGAGGFVLATWHRRPADRSSVLVGLTGLSVRF